MPKLRGGKEKRQVIEKNLYPKVKHAVRYHRIISLQASIEMSGRFLDRLVISDREKLGLFRFPGFMKIPPDLQIKPEIR